MFTFSIRRQGGEWGEAAPCFMFRNNFPPTERGGGPGLVSNLYFLVLRRHISDSGKKFNSDRRQKEGPGHHYHDLLTL